MQIKIYKNIVKIIKTFTDYISKKKIAEETFKKGEYGIMNHRYMEFGIEF